MTNISRSAKQMHSATKIWNIYIVGYRSDKDKPAGGL